jgi:hypothetical protein
VLVRRHIDYTKVNKTGRIKRERIGYKCACGHKVRYFF